MLPDQVLRRSRKDKRGAGGKHEVPAYQRMGRQSKGKNRITESGRTMVMSARADLWRGVDKCQDGAREQCPVICQFEVHEWLK